MSEDQSAPTTPPSTTPPTTTTQAPPVTPPSTATGDSSAGTQNTVPPASEAAATVPFTRFKEVNDQLAKLRSEADAATKAKKVADDKALAEQNRWQELAQGREKEIADLQPKVAIADRLTAIMARQLDDEIKEWPESVRKIMPPADAPLIERIEWAERTRPLARELIDATSKGKGTRFPAQHSGTTEPQTTKDAAQAILNKSYRRKTTDGKGSR